MFYSINYDLDITESGIGIICYEFQGTVTVGSSIYLWGKDNKLIDKVLITSIKEESSKGPVILSVRGVSRTDFKHCNFLSDFDHKLEMKDVLGGTFYAGQVDICEPHKKPVSYKGALVKVYDYQISLTPVLNCLFSNYSKENKFNNVNYFQKPQLKPVFNISWYQAIDFCNWLSEKEGYDCCYSINKKRPPFKLMDGDEMGWQIFTDFNKNGYRLPVNVEWEYTYKNKLSENIGEIQEWCWDRYLPFYYNKDFPKNFEGPGQMDENCNRMIKGSKDPKEVLKYENGHTSGARPDLSFENVGFRVVRTLNTQGNRRGNIEVLSGSKL